tara:strand:+ start:202 stop:1095 length:894 start_codon:yes stop_codon:yes gene_type:complete
MPVVNPNTLARGIKAQFQTAYAAVLASTELQGLEAIITTIQSDGEDETYNWLGDVPAVYEWLGDKTAGDLQDYTYSITNRDWATAISVDRNALADEQIAGIQPRIAFMARAMAMHKWELISDLLINGETDLAYDGSAFFADRTAPNDNLLTGTGTTIAQLKADITTARVAQMKFTDPVTGRLLQIVGDTIYCPPDLEGSFLEIVAAGTPDNSQGSFNAQGRWIRNVIVDPRLTDANDWYLLATNYPLRPFIFQDRMAPSVVVDRTEEARNRKIIYSVEARRNAGYGFYQLAVKTANT